MYIRLAKIILMGGFAIQLSIIAVDNMLNNHINLQSVQHILSMDTVFKDNMLTWRAITSPFIQDAIYGAIITAQFSAAIFAFIGTVGLALTIHDVKEFHATKKFSVISVIIALLVWFVGFGVIGTEWFNSWQSPTWTAEPHGFRKTVFCLLLLLILMHKDVETDP